MRDLDGWFARPRVAVGDQQALRLQGRKYGRRARRQVCDADPSSGVLRPVSGNHQAEQEAAGGVPSGVV